MPIPVLRIKERMASRLDAENSDRYLFDQDYKPSLNAAQDAIISLVAPFLAKKKFSSEGLREITFTRIWQTNLYSRISFDTTQMGHSLWTIIGVYPKPKINKGAGPSPQTDKAKSVLRTDVSFISSDESAQRLTSEEWNNNSKNVFEPGNSILNKSLAFYGYRDFSDFTSSSYSGAGGLREISIRPDVPNEFVAVEYIKYPTQVVTINDYMDFPESMTELIVATALEYIAWKQGDRTSIFEVSDLQTKRLLTALTQ